MEKRIVNANSLAAKEVLLETILKLGSSKTKEETNEWLTLNLGTELFGVWLLYEEYEVSGMLIAETIFPDSAYVAMDWTKAGVSKEGLLQKLEEWSRKLGLKKMIRYTNKSPTTFIKKYGWSVWQTVLVKEL